MAADPKDQPMSFVHRCFGIRHNDLLPEEGTNSQAARCWIFPLQSFCKNRAIGRHHWIMTSLADTIRTGAADSPEEELSAVSIWAFTLGVFALLTFGLTALPSIICGHVALSRTRHNSLSSLGRSVAFVG